MKNSTNPHFQGEIKMEKDYNLHICASENRAVFVDKFDDETVWLSIQTPGGSSNVTLTFKEARQVVAAINRIVEEVVRSEN